jgi:hypothetical protein
MKLKSFGCSFIFGTDLADAGTQPETPPPSQHTWPGLIAKHYDYDYECLARPGGGNLQILENIITQTIDPEPSVYFINWTWIDRFDYWNDSTAWAPNKFGCNRWTTTRPGETDQQSEFYYKNLHHSYSDKFLSLLYAKSAIDILTEKQIPFVMTYMDNLMFETEFHVSNAITTLQNTVKPYLMDFEGQTFLDWSRKRNYAISKNWHPLEQAHRAAADYLINSFDKQKTGAPVLPVRV